MQAERCNVELGIFALSQSSKTMWELHRSPGKRAKPLRLMNLTSQKETKTFWNYYFLISASGAHTCLHFKGRRIYIGYSWSWFFFILMPFVEDLSFQEKFLMRGRLTSSSSCSCAGYWGPDTGYDATLMPVSFLIIWSSLDHLWGPQLGN